MGNKKVKVLIIWLLVALVGSMVYIFIKYYKDIGFMENIFGVQKIADDAGRNKEFDKSEYLKQTLKKGSDERLKYKSDINKSNPFALFKEQGVSLKSNKAVKEEANTTKKVDNKPKGDNSKATVNAAKKEEDQYFYSIEGETRAEKRYFLAVTKLPQTISEGKLITLFLKEDMPSIGLKANTQLLGNVTIDFNRIKIRITSIVLDKKVMPVNENIVCYDQDFNEGILFNNNYKSDSSGIKNSVIEDILDELDSKPLNITKKYIDKGTSVDNEKILIPKGKDIFLAIVQKGDYQY